MGNGIGLRKNIVLFLQWGSPRIIQVVVLGKSNIPSRNFLRRDILILLRCLADSNCCRRFCRPLPSHSVKTPFGFAGAKIRHFLHFARFSPTFFSLHGLFRRFLYNLSFRRVPYAVFFITFAVMNSLEEKVGRTIERYGLLRKDAAVLVALSGGADSVCLLRLLLRMGYRCAAAHCNFHLRGAESVRDENFVTELCKGLGVDLFKADFDTIAQAREQQKGIEEMARDLRYSFFEALRLKHHFHAIVVAHHLNDNAETLLLHLVRGAGLHGLGGMRWRNGFVVRPLLEVSRKDILDYLKILHQPFVVDSTNLLTDATRNKVRLEVMPLLRKLNPKADEALSRAAKNLADADDYLAACLDADAKKVCAEKADKSLDVDLQTLRTLRSPRILLHHILYKYGFNGTQEQQLVEEEPRNGLLMESPGFCLTYNRGHLLIVPKMDSEDASELTIEGCGVFNRGGKVLAVEKKPLDALDKIPRSPDEACLDASKVKFPLCWRLVCVGDRFHPFGMKGSKLLSDFLTEHKLSRFDKERQTVVCSADGKIVWVVGLRPDEHFRIAPKTTATVLLLKIN